MLLLLPASSSAAPPAQWWNAAWPYRARIECPAGEGNVAAVRVTLGGRTTPDGRDLRLIDEGGRPRNFEILHHDSKLTTALQMAVPANAPFTAWLYYGNMKAQPIDPLKIAGVSDRAATDLHAKWRRSQLDREDMLNRQKDMQAQLARLREQQAMANQAPNVPQPVKNRLAQGIQMLEHQLQAMQIPPELPEPEDPSHWRPQRGVILRIYRKAKPDEPKTLDDLKRMAALGTLEGAGFRRGISDGFNPFGASDQYISAYVGYLRIEKPGEYAFCSVSDDGSWVVVNGQKLVEWPGPHSWGGAEHGQHNGRIKLEPGVAKVEYYHEETTETQLAYLGWKPPGAEGFTPIPPEQWTSVRTGNIAEYEAHGRPIMAVPEARIVSTYWIRDTDNRQATLVEYTDHSRSTAGSIVQRAWRLGDGLLDNGQSMKHLYFRVYRPAVELTVTDAKGNADSVMFSPDIYQFDVQSNAFEYGDAKAYSKIAAPYDVAKMERDDLDSYVDFCGQVEDWGRLAPAAETYLRRFPESPGAARLAGEASQAYARPESYDPKMADKLLLQALRGAKEDATRRELLMRRAALLTWGLADYPAAGKLYEQLQKLAAGLKGAQGKEMTRRCTIGLADVALLSGDAAKAEELYAKARKLARRKIDDPEELAKTGSYPYSVEDLLARQEYEWAIKTVDEWEDEFPEQKLQGFTFFMRGKVLFVEHPSEMALRYLSLSEQVAPRGVHVPEALWLHANCLMAMGRYADALQDLQRIRSDFTQTEYYTKAAAKIAECEAKLPKQPATQGAGKP